MPIIDVTVPKAILTADQNQQFTSALTRALLKAEGFPDPDARRLSTTWVYLNEIDADTYTAGGALRLEQQAPRWRISVTVPTGVLSDEAKSILVGDITALCLGAEGTPVTLENALRIYCLIEEISDGNWGTAGRILRLADMRALAAATSS